MNLLRTCNGYRDCRELGAGRRIDCSGSAAELDSVPSQGEASVSASEISPYDKIIQYPLSCLMAELQEAFQCDFHATHRIIQFHVSRVGSCYHQHHPRGPLMTYVKPPTRFTPGRRERLSCSRPLVVSSSALLLLTTKRTSITVVVSRQSIIVPIFGSLHPNQMACRAKDCPLRSSRMLLSGFSLHAAGRRTSLCGRTITFEFFWESVLRRRGMEGRDVLG